MPTSASSTSNLYVHAEGADVHLQEIEKELIEHFVELAAIVGLPRSYGAIYGVLFASPRPLRFSDIHERLGLSKGSVSQGLHALREIGAIRPVEVQWERGERFVPETELRQLLSGFLNRGLRPRLKTGTVRIEAMRSRHKQAGRSDEARLIGSRLEKLHGWHRKGGMLLPVITKFLG